MGDVAAPEQRDLVRAAAEEILGREVRQSWHRDYRQMARGTLAALDWVEGRRETAPSTGEYRRPDDRVVLGRRGYETSALQVEINNSEDWGSGHVRPPNEDMHFHGAVWSLLRWWRSPTDRLLTLAITVPGLDV
ncbi:hypothetical protein [Actinomycetospora flava]|uniref:Uncharacterized protein n=1 Tax=Actinomycetospora flava TaxID=3129232 RepID=A0ABU8MHP4_9PSEU